MLEIRNVTKIFNAGTVNEKTALDHISLRVEDGDFITIVGSNGAGKSTLFQMISGVQIPDEGNLILDGKDITFDPDYMRSTYIGRLFQDPLKGTAPHMTIGENLALAWLRAGNPKPFSRISRKDREFFRERLRQLDMGLEDRMDTPVGTLSGGQRQALTLLMATLQQPKLLLLDEHTAALDPKTAAKVLEITDQLISENQLTALMVTHNMRDAIAHGNRLIMMHEGHIILDIAGEEKKKLTVEALLEKFSATSGSEFSNDRALLN